MKNSAVNPSDPGDLLFFIPFKEVRISSLEILFSIFSFITELNFGISYPWRILFKSTSSKQLSLFSYKLIKKDLTSSRMSSWFVIIFPSVLLILVNMFLLTYCLFSSPQKYLVGFSPSSIHVQCVLINSPSNSCLLNFLILS